MNFNVIPIVLLLGINMWMNHRILTSKRVVVLNFHNKYRNVMYYLKICLNYRENECVINGQDYFRYLKNEIGKTSQDIIFMSTFLNL